MRSSSSIRADLQQKPAAAIQKDEQLLKRAATEAKWNETKQRQAMQQLLGSGGDEPFHKTARLGTFKAQTKQRVGEFNAERRSIDGPCSSCLAAAATSHSGTLHGLANSKSRRSGASANSKPRVLKQLLQNTDVIATVEF